MCGQMPRRRLEMMVGAMDADGRRALGQHLKTLPDREEG